MYLFYVTKFIHTTRSAIVLHVSVLCDKNCPHYSECYSTTCICSMWQKLSSLLAVLYIVLHVFVLCDKNCPHYSQCYSITCICSMWQNCPRYLQCYSITCYLFYVTKTVLTTRSVIVLHVSVLCDKIYPYYSQCYSITCICSMWQKLSSLLAVL
jgi:hypothetical protein